VDLEKGEMGRHCHFKNGDPLPLEPNRVLGRGGFGQVDEVTSTVSNRIYARTRVLRTAAFRDRKNEGLKRFIEEIKILKRLKHEHIVQFVGSYTDPKYIGLIMSPVADMDLGIYLTWTTTSNRPELRTFFGCLTTALVFLHGQNVRHKDIKPGNILVSRGIVLFTDFGLSLDFKDADGSTTVGMVNALSRRYCAPEVIEFEPRNSKSDIWSLGVVFMEMMVVLKGKKIQDMDDFFEQRGTHSIFLRNNLAILPEFIAELKGSGELSDNTAFRWIQKMLSLEHYLRPSATSILTSISAPDEQGWNTRFLGVCCVPPEEDFSDFSGN
jgi:serine/threonine protein kinase